MIHGGCTVIQQSTFIRKDAFRKTGGFNSNNRTSWDGELLIDLGLCNAKFQLIPDVLGNFRLYDGSISGGGLNERYLADTRRFYKKVKGYERDMNYLLLKPYYRLLKYLSRPDALANKVVLAARRKYL